MVRFCHRRARLDSSPRQAGRRGQACGVGTPAFSSPCRRRSRVMGPARWRAQASVGPGVWEGHPLGEEQASCPPSLGTGPRVPGDRNQDGDRVYGTQFWTNDILSLFSLEVR